jgi:Cof subfamily protein (haloacid dehalogenase superfamily)
MENNIGLVLADVDGTLVTHEKLLTPRAIAAVENLGKAGILFAVTSGRPPRGMQMLIEPLKLTTPIAAFNGGLFVKNDFTVVEQHVLTHDVAARAIDMILEAKLDPWLYVGNDWFVHERHGPHVDREEWTVKFPPKVVADFEPHLHDIAKIVGVSDDLEAVAATEKKMLEAFAGGVCLQRTCPSRDDVPSIARSQPYYLDITHPEANKGAVVEALTRMLNIPAEKIATLGDMPNDVPMFKKSGMSIAMGQSSGEVKKSATFVTESCDAEGFAIAIEKHILGAAVPA